MLNHQPSLTLVEGVSRASVSRAVVAADCQVALLPQDGDAVVVVVINPLLLFSSRHDLSANATSYLVLLNNQLKWN